MITYEGGLITATCNEDGSAMELVQTTVLDFGDEYYSYICPKCGEGEGADLSDLISEEDE